MKKPKKDDKEKPRNELQPKLQEKIGLMKSKGIADSDILKQLQADGDKKVLQEIKWWTDRHDHQGYMLR